MNGDTLPNIPTATRDALLSRVAVIRALPNVSRIILFGSYAKGTNRPDSDIDLAVFYRSDKRSLLDEYRELSHICAGSDVEIQVQAFSDSELSDPCGVIEEIVMYGVDL